MLAGSRRHRCVREANRLIRRIIYVLLGKFENYTNKSRGQLMLFLQIDCKTNCSQQSELPSSLCLIFSVKVWISLQKRNSLLHRKSYEHPAMDISSYGGLTNGNPEFLFFLKGCSFQYMQVTQPGHASQTPVQSDLRATWSLRVTKREPLQQTMCFAFQSIYGNVLQILDVQSMAPIHLYRNQTSHWCTFAEVSLVKTDKSLGWVPIH